MAALIMYLYTANNEGVTTARVHSDRECVREGMRVKADRKSFDISYIIARVSYIGASIYISQGSPFQLV